MRTTTALAVGLLLGLLIPAATMLALTEFFDIESDFRD